MQYYLLTTFYMAFAACRDLYGAYGYQSSYNYYPFSSSIRPYGLGAKSEALDQFRTVLKEQICTHVHPNASECRARTLLTFVPSLRLNMPLRSIDTISKLTTVLDSNEIQGALTKLKTELPEVASDKVFRKVTDIKANLRNMTSSPSEFSEKIFYDDLTSLFTDSSLISPYESALFPSLSGDLSSGYSKSSMSRSSSSYSGIMI